MGGKRASTIRTDYIYIHSVVCTCHRRAMLLIYTHNVLRALLSVKGLLSVARAGLIREAFSFASTTCSLYRIYIKVSLKTLSLFLITFSYIIN